MESLPASELVLDFSFYPRHTLDRHNLRSILTALEAGEHLPPVRADRASRRVTDGFHRVTAYLRLDANLPVEVDLIDYPDEAAMLLDAGRANARHGARLTSYDQAHYLGLCDGRGISREDAAEALAITVDKADAIRRSRTGYDKAGRPLQIKRSARHLAGQELDDSQVRANERSSGWPLSFHCEQIINALDGGIFNWDEESEVAALRHLSEVLARYLSAQTV